MSTKNYNCPECGAYLSEYEQTCGYCHNCEATWVVGECQYCGSPAPADQLNCGVCTDCDDELPF